MTPATASPARRGIHLSFEFFPPKSAEAEGQLWETAAELSAYDPGFMSVTYGAGGSTKVPTLSTVRHLLKMGLPAASHLTCVGATKEEVHAVVADFQAVGVKHFVALRGDPPGGVGTAYQPHPGGYANAAELAAGVPRTEVMSEANREDLWARRRELFFKPATGYGSRASYRGDKLTHKTWEQMASTAYVAQQVVPPSERRPGDGADALKVDIRAYAYEGRVLGLAARTYRGQTTNFRTPGGGFAPVVTLEWASGAPETQNRPKPVFR